MKRFIWGAYMFLFCRPYSLKQFKIFCIKMDGMTQKEWDEYEMEIRSSKTLSEFFKL